MHLSIIFLLITVQPLAHYQKWFFDFPQKTYLNTSYLTIVATSPHPTCLILKTEDLFSPCISAQENTNDRIVLLFWIFLFLRFATSCQYNSPQAIYS